MIDWLVTNALAALVLAAIAGVLIWTFRPAPAVRHALWLVVLLKLVAPVGPTVALPVKDPPPCPPAPPLVEVAPASDDPLVCEEQFVAVIVDAPYEHPPEEATALALARLREADEASDARCAPAVVPLPAAELPPAAPIDFRPWLIGLWVVGAGYVGWRQVRETVRFARFARTARPAPDHLVAEVAVVANRLGVRVPAVRMLVGLTSPVMWCLGRPVLLWPAGLECRLKGEGRRAVIAHELAHLRRRDHWVRRLEMVAAVLHWWNPLFWVARKRLRADAELACDAWAAGQADRRAYAEALLEVCSFNPRRRPAPAVGVFGEGRRAMQERLTMIMRDRVPCRLAFGAKLVVALMAIAAVPAWTLGQQGKPDLEVVADDEVKVFRVIEVTEEADADDDAAAREIEAQIKALAQKLAALKAGKKAGVEKSATDKLKAAQEKIKGAEEKAKVAREKAVERVRELRVQVDAAGEGKRTVIAGPARVLQAGQNGVKVIGPDGKEIKGARVIIGGAAAGQGGPAPVARPLVVRGQAGDEKKVELKVIGPDGKPKTVEGTVAKPVTVADAAKIYRSAFTTTGGGNAITLSRATYKLNRDQATALSSLLGSIKATVMETKVDGDNLTVTTTPEAQQTIGQIVRLISGQGSGNTFRYEWKGTGTPAQGLFTPAAPAAPATPAKPAAPAKPAKPSAVKPASGEQPATVDVEVILNKLKPAAGEKAQPDIDMSKLQDLLKTLVPQTKPAKPAGEKP